MVDNRDGLLVKTKSDKIMIRTSGKAYQDCKTVKDKIYLCIIVSPMIIIYKE